jgi:hypothetical protein
MKNIVVCSIVMLVPCLGFAGNGHVNRVIDVEVESTSVDGLKSLSVRDTVLRVDEIDYMDRTRQLILSKHGESANDWPIMVDTKSKTATYFNRTTEKYTVLKFSELQ